MIEKQYELIHHATQKLMTAGLIIAPLLLMASGSILLSDNNSWPYKATVFLYVFTFLFLLKGYTHAMHCYYNRKLCEIEHRSQKPSVPFYSEFTGKGMRVIPGVRLYNLLLGIVLLVPYVFISMKTYSELTLSQVAPAIKWLVFLLPIAVNIAVLVLMAHVELKARYAQPPRTRAM